MGEGEVEDDLNVNINHRVSYVLYEAIMDYIKKINFADLPDDPFEVRASLLSSTGGCALAESAKYINERYGDRDMLKLAVDFSTEDLLDAAPSYFDSIKKVWFFPWVEAGYELEKSLNLIMLSSYKNSYDSMRRALELMIIAAFYVLDSIDAKKARSWLSSNRNTPNFKRAVEELIKHEPYLNCERQCEFTKHISDIYYELSDYIHVKGVEKSNSRLESAMYNVHGVHLFVFNESACGKSLNLLIETIRMISLVCALIIPQLLVGLEIYQKFGINGPASGFFTPEQATRICTLIPENFKAFIDELKKCDDVRSIEEWFYNLPDISEEELKEQFEEQAKNFPISD